METLYQNTGFVDLASFTVLIWIWGFVSETVADERLLGKETCLMNTNACDCMWLQMWNMVSSLPQDILKGCLPGVLLCPSKQSAFEVSSGEPWKSHELLEFSFPWP